MPILDGHVDEEHERRWMVFALEVSTSVPQGQGKSRKKLTKLDTKDDQG